MKHSQEPSCVSLVFGVLVGSDDFKTVQQLKDETRCNMNQVLAALCHLKMHKAVEMITSGHDTFWFATPDSDNRTKTLETRKIEDKPRKKRRVRKTP